MGFQCPITSHIETTELRFCRKSKKKMNIDRVGTLSAAGTPDKAKIRLSHFTGFCRKKEKIIY